MKKRIICIIAIFLVCVPLLTGCGTPKTPDGYSRNVLIIHNWESDDTSPYPAHFYLDKQFENDNKLDDGKSYFRYIDELYYINSTEERDEWSLYHSNYFSVYEDEGNRFIGETVKPDEKNTNWNYDIIFADGNYLYYEIRLIKEKSYFRFSPEGFTDKVSFFKCNFYRFDLETGENENIGLDLFFEKLSQLDNTVVLKD